VSRPHPTHQSKRKSQNRRHQTATLTRALNRSPRSELGGSSPASCGAVPVPGPASATDPARPDKTARRSPRDIDHDRSAHTSRLSNPQALGPDLPILRAPHHHARIRTLDLARHATLGRGPRVKTRRGRGRRFAPEADLGPGDGAPISLGQQADAGFGGAPAVAVPVGGVEEDGEDFGVAARVGVVAGAEEAEVWTCEVGVVEDE
ncbi:MAG: hypothetical protein LQ347_007097, partial [Umbilicaria vellea]